MRTAVLEEMPELFWQELEKHNLLKWFNTEVNFSEEIAVIRTKTLFDRELIDRFANLKLIIRAGSGFDNIDANYAETKNIKVCNTPEANAFSAYEHTIAQILALIKNLQIGKKEIQERRWKEAHPGNWEIAELKVLVVGLGRVGKRVADTLQYLGAEVKAVDPYLTSKQWQEKAIEPIHYIEGLKWCNLLTFHCPLYHETLHYFDEACLRQLQHPLWLINSARGKVVDLAAVEKGLKNNKLLGVALDVFESEPMGRKDLFDDPRMILSPHTGSFTRAAKNRMSRETIYVWKSFVDDKQAINQVERKFIY